MSSLSTEVDRSSAAAPPTEDSGGNSEQPNHSPPPPDGPSRRRFKLGRWIFSIGLLTGVAGWLAYHYTHHAVADRAGDEQLALDVVGGWWNVVGDRYLELDWEGRRAILRDYSVSEDGVESVGSWRTTSQTIVIEVNGKAGRMAQELEIIGNEAELFLAPVPVSGAKLMDCWIADHGDEQEDAPPSSPSAREAAWTRPVKSRHAGRTFYRGHPPSSMASSVAAGGPTQ
jgi:hypothetical protein